MNSGQHLTSPCHQLYNAVTLFIVSYFNLNSKDLPTPDTPVAV